jgi:hypothetical protein
LLFLSEKLLALQGETRTIPKANRVRYKGDATKDEGVEDLDGELASTAY